MSARRTKCTLSRRDFLARTAMASAVAVSSRAATAPRKPNVIVILTDDQGSADAPGFGATDLVMPNVDALGNGGVRFTQFYAGAPVCSPSRAALLTGRYPLRAGMPNNAPGDDRALPQFESQTTMADMFKKAGYATAHIGKWHQGSSPAGLPNARGFDYSFGHINGCIDNYSHYFYWSGPNRHDLQRNGEEVFEEGRHFLDLMADEAEQFIGAHRERPFFLYFAANAPHYPYQPDEKWLKHFAALPYPRNLYAAFLSTLDDRIGRLMQCLDTNGIRDNTIVVFQSDNGHSTEERAHFGGGSAAQLRGAKFSLFEGGIRVPAIIHWKGHVPAGETRDAVAHACDWMPTLAALCGVDAPVNIDGKSLAGVIESAANASPHDELHWQVGTDPNAPWAVRKGDWKLLGNPNDTGAPGAAPIAEKQFLVNLKDDPSERTNRAASEPDTLRELEAAHAAWLASLTT